MARLSFLLLIGLSTLGLRAQNTIVQQGFEASVACPDWTYTGGNLNTETARTGSRSMRVGRQGESTTVTFAPVTLTGYLNVQLSLYHSARGGMGPGMDTDEGAIIQVRIDGGPWSTVAAVTGFGDCSWPWSSTGGCSGSCNNSMPNPAVYNIPNGTSQVEVRVCSTNCSGGSIMNYNRTDEGFFIDDVKLTTTSSVVTPGSGNLTWNGSVSTDWFDCRNWTPNHLPGPGWNVTIDQTSVNQCVVGNSVSTPMNAYCAGLTVSTTGTVSRKLTVDNGRSLVAAGPAVVQRLSTGVDSAVVLLKNGSFTSGGLTVSGDRAMFQDNLVANTAQIKGNVLLTSNGKINLNNGVLGVEGDITNNVSTSAFLRNAGSKVIINGSGPQTISAGFPDAYTSLSIYKEADDVTLAAPITVSGTLDLYLGRVFTSTAGLLTMKANSTVINASNGSFVHGPMRKEGNTAFTFPVGKGGTYRPLLIAGTAAGTGTYGTNLPTNQFQAEYFATSPNIAIGTLRDVTIDHVSDCEYWTLDRTGAQASTPFVRLSWDTPASCGVTLPSDLRVVRWTGSIWNDRGSSNVTGTNASGWLSTAIAQTAFSPWTLASVSTQNPLPIQLLSFTAKPEGDDVRLDWTTLTEEDNDHFTVERSSNGNGFTGIAQVPGAGTSVAELHYTTLDKDPLPGLSYYRLRQTDMDGGSTVSGIVPVLFKGRTNDDLVLLPAADRLTVRHRLPAGQYGLFDANGRLVDAGTAPEGVFGLPLDGLAPGLYLLRVTAGSIAASGRFMH
ncbi:MAG: hypothetical protein JST66_07515 [Bacteroidetes bacterium]|nr:hypothetical protein [Bacteroidota bacterium]